MVVVKLVKDDTFSPVIFAVEVVRMNGELSDNETETAITKDEQKTEKEELNGETESNEEKEDKDGKKEGEKDEEEDKDQEVVLIQDTGFNVKIVVPGIEEFELPVSYRILFNTVIPPYNGITTTAKSFLSLSDILYNEQNGFIVQRCISLLQQIQFSFKKFEANTVIVKRFHCTALLMVLGFKNPSDSILLFQADRAVGEPIYEMK